MNAILPLPRGFCSVSSCSFVDKAADSHSKAKAFPNAYILLVFRVSEHMVQQLVIVVQQLEHVLLLLCLPHNCQQNDCVGKTSSWRLCCDVWRGQVAMN